MILRDVARYFAARFLHRGPHTKRYLQNGLGLEHRTRNLAAFWAPHQERTRAVQRRWAETASGEVLTVLGAGRLFDFDDVALLPRFARLRLVDADPLCRSAWDAKIDKPFEPVFADVSGCIDHWLERLHESCRSRPWTETLDFIRTALTPCAGYSAPSDALLSLNLMSQLPVGWQEGVEAFLKERFGATFVAKQEQEWLAAVRPGNRMLVEQHLAAIERCGAKDVLLITDVEYVQYFGRKYSRSRWQPEPVRWTAESGWSTDPGVTCEVDHALEELDLMGGAAFAEWLPSYRMLWQEQWLWHISPMEVECRHCGTVHQVAAFALERKAQ